LLDLKEKYVDVEVLRALSKSVEKNLKDAASDQSILKYKQTILQLFGRITSLVNFILCFKINPEIVKDCIT
jgi:hypothetical protein